MIETERYDYVLERSSEYTVRIPQSSTKGCELN